MKLKAMAGVIGICLLGIEYLPDSEGAIYLPDDLARVALQNGFVVAESEDEAPAQEALPE
jgi:hypothetical protein